MSEQEVPGRATESNVRLTERGYESDFARLPDAEVESIPVPGGGPQGAISGSTNVPLVVVVVGFVLVFANFGFESLWLLLLGMLLILGGGVWAKLRNRTEGKGSGPVTVARR